MPYGNNPYSTGAAFPNLAPTVNNFIDNLVRLKTHQDDMGLRSRALDETKRQHNVGAYGLENPTADPTTGAMPPTLQARQVQTAEQEHAIAAAKTPHLQNFDSISAGMITNQLAKFGVNDKDLLGTIRTMGSTPGVTKQQAMQEILTQYPNYREKLIQDSVDTLLKNSEKDPNYVNTPQGLAHQRFIGMLDSDTTGEQTLGQTAVFGPVQRALQMEEAASRAKMGTNDWVKVVGPDGKPTLVPATADLTGQTPFTENKPAASHIIEIPSADGKTAQKFDYNVETKAITPIGAPYAVKSQVTNVNVNQASNPQVETLAAGILDGTIDPNGISKRGNLQGAVWARVKELNPAFNIVKAGAGAKFEVSINTMQTKALLNTIDPLLTKLEQSGAALGNSTVPGYNKAVNFLKEQYGSADIVGFNNLRDDVVAEVERGLLGTGVLSDNKYQRALKNLNSAQSLPQLKAAIANTKTVIRARLEALAAGPNAPIPTEGQSRPPVAVTPGQMSAIQAELERRRRGGK